MALDQTTASGRAGDRTSETGLPLESLPSQRRPRRCTARARLRRWRQPALAAALDRLLRAWLQVVRARPQRAQASCGRQTWHLVFERVFRGDSLRRRFALSETNGFFSNFAALMPMQENARARVRVFLHSLKMNNSRLLQFSSAVCGRACLLITRAGFARSHLLMPLCGHVALTQHFSFAASLQNTGASTALRKWRNW